MTRAPARKEPGLIGKLVAPAPGLEHVWTPAGRTVAGEMRGTIVRVWTVKELGSGRSSTMVAIAVSACEEEQDGIVFECYLQHLRLLYSRES